MVVKRIKRMKEGEKLLKSKEEKKDLTLTITEGGKI